jgi:hypothetical protein
MPLNNIKSAETPKKRGYKKLKAYRVEKMDGGGHMVEHHYDSGDAMTYHEPEKRVFGKTESKQLKAHIEELHGKLGISESAQVEKEPEANTSASEAY